MKWIKFWGAVSILAILLLRPGETVASAQQAMKIWYTSVAPALFPFLALMPLLTSEEACKAYEALFSRWMRPLFRLPGSAAPAVIAGMIAGSPGGAITLKRVAVNSNLSPGEARRIALAVSGVSPAYLIIGVGQGLHGSVRLGMNLALAQACTQLLLLALLPSHREDHERICGMDQEIDQRNPITAAVESILGVCGYMVFYGVIAGALSGMLGEGIGDALLLIMDLPSGLAALAKSQLPMKLMLQGAAIGFSGMCIISQNLNALKGLNLKRREYLVVRLASAFMIGLASIAMQSGWMGMAGKMSEALRKSYAISLLFAAIAILPGLYLLSKQLFLNKRKREPH